MTPAVDDDPHAVRSLSGTEAADPIAGRVVWSPGWSLWTGGMTAAAVVLGPLTFSWSALAVFVLMTGGLLMLGWSVGYHRRMIHRSFACPRWVETILIWCGAAAGLGGPLGVYHQHDLRDWGQRRAECHAYLRNGASTGRDWLWTMHGRLELERPPMFAPPPELAEDRFVLWLERTWMLQQLPIAGLLWLGGGWGWVVWGVAVRIAVSVTGHWLVGRLAHTVGPQSWIVTTSGVQAHDVPWAAIPTFGEAWHNNHHAWPGSARIGLEPGQADWGYRFIQTLERLGLAWDVRTPETLGRRGCVEAVA